MKLLTVDSAEWATGGDDHHGGAGNNAGGFFDFTNGFHGVTLITAVTVVVLYSLGVRLTAIAGDASEQRPAWVQPLAYVCFGPCGLAVLFGLFLVIPYFSK